MVIPRAFFFRSAVDFVESNNGRTENFGADASQSSGQRGFTVVDVTDGANVDVREGTVKFFSLATTINS